MKFSIPASILSTIPKTLADSTANHLLNPNPNPLNYLELIYGSARRGGGCKRRGGDTRPLDDNRPQN